MEPWLARLAEGDTAGAWDLFIGRYRRLITFTIRHILRDEGVDVLDAFAHVCQALAIDDLARPRRYTAARSEARFATWLVAVVRNLTIDWVRGQRGRLRASIPAGLSPLQRQIFERVFLERLTHAEAYERIRARSAPALSFGEFLRELAETHRVLDRVRPDGAVRYLSVPSPAPMPVVAPTSEEALTAAELGARVAKALESLPANERLALQLFVIDEMPAAEVARTVGWPNAKAVYNHVYRALAALRGDLERAGIGPRDLR